MVTILLVMPVVSLGCSDQILTEHLHSAPSYHLFADLSHQGKGRGFTAHLEGSLGVDNFFWVCTAISAAILKNPFCPSIYVHNSLLP